MHITTSRFEEGKNPEFVKSSDVYIVRDFGMKVPLTIYINNMTFSNDRNEANSHLVGWFTYNTTYIMKNINFINSEGFMMRMISKDLEIEGLTFTNVSVHTPYMVYVNHEGRYSVDGMNLSNVTDTGTQKTPLFYIFNSIDETSTDEILSTDSIDAITHSVENVRIVNSSFRNRRAVFYATGTPQSTFLTDTVQATDIILDGDMALVAYGIFKDINILNIQCLRVNSEQEGFNFVVKSDYSSEGTSPNNTQVIKNILIEESSVSVLSVTKPDALVEVTQSLHVSNVSFINLISSFSLELVKMHKMATVGSYSITMEDITFSNLTFSKETKLMYLQQQLETPLIIRNLNIMNVVFAGVTIEAFESNDIYNKTHVMISNMKATNVD